MMRRDCATRDVYKRQEEAVPNRFTYYGQQIDPITQQYYLRARFYNPVIGRFTQEDTYRGDGLNLYAYCANNPVFYTDPGGYACDGKDPLTSAQRVTYDAARVEGKTASQAYAIATGTNPLVPRMSWNEFQHNNRGYWTKHGLSEAYSRYLSTIVDLGEGSHYPVSYTHLDVYKRQLLPWRKARNLPRRAKEQTSRLFPLLLICWGI